MRAARVVGRDAALADLRANPAWQQALAVLPGNPLPDAVVVTLADGDNLAGRADKLAGAWKQWNHVDLVQLDSAWVQRLEAILRFARIGLGFLAACVAVVVLATVFNTVRMQALSQREEIGVARLVGATESFVRRPFLYLGALSGAVASLLAIGVAAIALSPLNDALLGLARSYGAEFALHLPGRVGADHRRGGLGRPGRAVGPLVGHAQHALLTLPRCGPVPDAPRLGNRRRPPPLKTPPKATYEARSSP